MDFIDWTTLKQEKFYKYKQIEKKEVLEPCLELCKDYLKKGRILQYRRLEGWYKAGEPDIEIWVAVGDVLSILMIECKKKDGTQQDNQKDYEKEYECYSNVKYLIVRSPQELKEIL
jgi:hypothetical protein